MDIGTLIKEARLQKGYTQEELADLVGVKKSAVAKWENGRVSEIKRSNLKMLAESLGINPNSLLGWSETEDTSEKLQKKNDTLTNIVLRLNNDPDFLSIVEKISNLDQDKLNGLNSFWSSCNMKSSNDSLLQRSNSLVISLIYNSVFMLLLLSPDLLSRFPGVCYAQII